MTQRRYAPIRKAGHRSMAHRSISLAQRAIQRRRLFLEPLELRVLLATVSMTAIDSSGTELDASNVSIDPVTLRFDRTAAGSSESVYFKLAATSQVSAEELDYSPNVLANPYTGARYVQFPANSYYVIVNVNGAYDQLDEGTEIAVFQIESVSGGYTFNGTATTAVTISDPDGRVGVSVTASDPEAEESGSGTGTFQISRSGSTASPLTVNYSIGGTAQSGDYSGLSGSVTIPANSTWAPIAVTAVDDSLYEQPNETITLTLQSSSNYTLATPSSATVTIIDNEPVPVGVSVTGVTVAENAGPANFTVTLSKAPTVDVTVAYRTATGTASGSDFVGVANGSVTIPAGQTSKPVSISIYNDNQYENDEFFTLELLSATNGLITSGKEKATGTITNDDLQVVSLSAPFGTVTEGKDDKGIIRFSRDSGLGTLSVSYSVLSGSEVDPVFRTTGIDGKRPLDRGER